jgi:hypothetical protein
MRPEPPHIMDVRVGQEAQGKADAVQLINRGEVAVEKPYSLRIGKSVTTQPGFIGIYVESLASSR